MRRAGREEEEEEEEEEDGFNLFCLSLSRAFGLSLQSVLCISCSGALSSAVDNKSAVVCVCVCVFFLDRER